MKEFGFNTVIALLGTFVTAWLGGWDVALKALVVFMVIDYATGVLSAIKEKKLDSEIMFWGGIRKAVILVVVAIAIIMDGMLGNTEPLLRTLAIYFYVGREGLSVTENLGQLGVPLPEAIRTILQQLNKEEAK